MSLIERRIEVNSSARIGGGGGEVLVSSKALMRSMAQKRESQKSKVKIARESKVKTRVRVKSKGKRKKEKKSFKKDKSVARSLTYTGTSRAPHRS